MKANEMMYGELCAEFYDIDKAFADADEINFYKRFLKKTDNILEPMCGSGRLLLPLLQEGYTIHGVDNSHSMLENCRERAAQLNVTPTLFQAAIESLSLPHIYHSILIPLGSFQLLYPRSTAYTALQKFNQHLCSGGKLILDLFIPWNALYENKEEEYTKKEVAVSDGSKIIHKSHDIANKYEQTIYSESNYEKINKGQVIAEEAEEMYICWYYRYEMEMILEKFGFKNILYKEEYFRNENHMIFIAEKT